MKILTVSMSPYYLTRLGRINSSVIIDLKNKGHQVYSAVWAHDINYFKQKDGKYYYEKDKKEICEIFPLYAKLDQVVPQFYQLFRKVKPDLIITISDYNEVDFVYSLKRLMPDQVKWLGVLACDATPINKDRYQVIRSVDYIISLNSDTYNEINIIKKVNNQYCPFGVDSQFWSGQKTINKVMKVLVVGKNSQLSGVAIAIKADDQNNKFIKSQTYIHTNIDDKGQHNLKYLIDRYNSNAKLPQRFVSIKDGLSDLQMRELYLNHDVVVDLSFRSSSGISVLQAISCGCIPICTKVGGLKDIINSYDIYCYHLSSSVMISQFQQQYQVPQIQSYKQCLLFCSKLFNNDQKHNQIIKQSIEVAKKFDLNRFLNKIEECMQIVINQKKQIKIQSYEF